MIALATIQRLEELVLNSSEPRTQLLEGGWLVRLSRDDVKRARSVTALADGGGELDERISRCEELFAVLSELRAFQARRQADSEAGPGLGDQLRHQG